MSNSDSEALAANPSAPEPDPFPDSLAGHSKIENQKSKIPTSSSRHRRGKVARLPEDVRNRINQMLDDGFRYRQIRDELGNHGKHLTDDDIRRWKNGGYQDYLRNEFLLDQCQARVTRALELLRENGLIKGFQATQQIAAAQICEAAAEIGAEVLRHALTANPLNYFRMLNTFARLTNGSIKCERHLADEAERHATHHKPRAKKGISRKSVKEMQSKLKLM